MQLITKLVCDSHSYLLEASVKGFNAQISDMGVLGPEIILFC